MAVVSKALLNIFHGVEVEVTKAFPHRTTYHKREDISLITISDSDLER